MRFFCKAGPVKPEIHYSLPPLERLNRESIFDLIRQEKYFVLHAPRQTGKTTAMLALEHDLNATGQYRALYVNVEPAQTARNDVARGVHSIMYMIGERARRVLGDNFPQDAGKQIRLDAGPDDALQALLARWAENCPLPLCLIIDEIDALVGDTLISVLRQIRSGYTERPKSFPHNIILCGVRDVRDYRIHRSDGEAIAGGSVFNIKDESLRLGDFSQDDIRRLYTQHTAETGQTFDEAVYPLVWNLTQGQPWLVNALADTAVAKLEKDRSKPITPEIILAAKEKLILDRVTHLDQLTHKLKEPRVQRIIEPLVRGDELDIAVIDSDDAQYLIDLGLVRRGRRGLEIANGIYSEVIPRELSYQMQMSFMVREDSDWYITPQGLLDMPKMFENFQQFYRENSEHWMSRYEYKEAGPQLILQAYLQRIVNGGGRIDREYGLGRRRTDLLIQWPHPAGIQRVVIELKMVRGTPEKTIAEGLVQTGDYMDKTGPAEGHLMIFDSRPGIPWDEKVYRRDAVTPHGRTVTVWGL